MSENKEMNGVFEESEKLTPAQKMIVEECDALKEMLLAKNRSYGNSALSPVRCFSKASVVEQINVRLDDKLSRISRGSEFGSEDCELDLCGYLLLKRVSKRFHALEKEKTT